MADFAGFPDQPQIAGGFDPAPIPVDEMGGGPDIPLLFGPTEPAGLGAAHSPIAPLAATGALPGAAAYGTGGGIPQQPSIFSGALNSINQTMSSVGDLFSPTGSPMDTLSSLSRLGNSAFGGHLNGAAELSLRTLDPGPLMRAGELAYSGQGGVSDLGGKAFADAFNTPRPPVPVVSAPATVTNPLAGIGGAANLLTPNSVATNAALTAGDLFGANSAADLVGSAASFGGSGVLGAAGLFAPGLLGIGIGLSRMGQNKTKYPAISVGFTGKDGKIGVSHANSKSITGPGADVTQDYFNEILSQATSGDDVTGDLRGGIHLLSGRRGTESGVGEGSYMVSVAGQQDRFYKTAEDALKAYVDGAYQAGQIKGDRAQALDRVSQAIEKTGSIFDYAEPRYRRAADATLYRALARDPSIQSSDFKQQANLADSGGNYEPITGIADPGARSEAQHTYNWLDILYNQEDKYDGLFNPDLYAATAPQQQASANLGP